jgi:AcrR family transcriptional regulator
VRLSVRELRKAELIEAAIRTIAERGYHETTIRDVAQAAGTASGSIHYHFANRDELLQAALVDSDRRFRSEVHAEVAAAEGAIAKLERLVELCFPEDEARVAFLKVVIDFWHQATRRDDFRSLFDDAHRAWIEELTKIIEDGSREGELSLAGGSSALDVAMGIAAMIDGLSLYCFVTNQVEAKDARRIIGERLAELRPSGDRS